MRRHFMLMALAISFSVCALASRGLAQGCPYGETCTVELPGAECADGTPMFMNVTPREGASRLYIYLQGGGACWDGVTCGCGWDGSCSGGTAATLTRPDSGSVRSGWHSASTPGNPITLDYNIIEIPYCSGDLFMGNKLQTFGGRGRGLKQFGYRSLGIALETAKELFPRPQSVVFMGSSAGGLGASFNLHQIRRIYPVAPLSLIVDSGTPFKAPFVNQRGIDKIMNAWSLRDNIPEDYFRLVPGPLDMAGIVKYNARRYPEHNYALISSYNDLTMNSFAILIGSIYGFFAVHGILNDVADHDLGERQKVFYVPGKRHTFHEQPLTEVVANGVNLGEWLAAMLGDQADWPDQRSVRGLEPTMVP